MKYIYIRLGIICMFCALVSCGGDKEAGYLTISLNEVELDIAGDEVRVEVLSNERLIQSAQSGNWVNIDRDAEYFVISAGSNPTRTPRKASIYIVAGDKYGIITVSQPGSLREVGEPYPDAENPVGIIYKLTDGGRHGKVVSLDQGPNTTWGESNQTNPGARDMWDGKKNTRHMIETYRDAGNFETAYGAFARVYAKNGGNLDGDWYLPSFYELMEMYFIMTGNVFTEPETDPVRTERIDHDRDVRNQFNAWITEHGGVAFAFATTSIWTSTEYDATRGRSYTFYSVATAAYHTKTLPRIVRPVMSF